MESGYSTAFRSRWTHLSCEWPSLYAQIDQSEHRERAVGIPGQPPIADLGEAPDALYCEERMLNLATHNRLVTVGFFVRLAQGPTPVDPLIGEVLCAGGDFLELLALALSPVGIISVEPSLNTMQHGWATLGCHAR